MQTKVIGAFMMKIQVAIDRYLGYDIYITEDVNYFYGEISLNGKSFDLFIQGGTGESCLANCESWVDDDVLDKEFY